MRSSLTVLSVAYPFAPVGPDAVGGAEQILWQLDRALVAGGHQSLVIACRGSICSGHLLPLPIPEGPWSGPERSHVHQLCRQSIGQALQEWEVDLIHLHGLDCLEYLPPAGVPVLISLHLPTDWYPEPLYRVDRPQTHLQCVSRTQWESSPPAARTLAPIENGVDTLTLVPSGWKRDFALALGRICPEKGFHLALDAAHLADLPLVLAGQTFPYAEHRNYLRKEIVPRLDRHRRYVGPIGIDEKRRLLPAARCLVVPSLVEETSSLVAMEALACGTPVVALARGALREIVEPGRTGFLVRDVAEMAWAIDASRFLDPRACRHAALTRFSAERMSSEYLHLYAQLAAVKDHAAFH